MTGYYRFRTRAGEFRIAPAPAGWLIWHDGNRLDGPFPRAQSAAEDLANGHSAWPACGDPSRLDIPDDIADWELIPR